MQINIITALSRGVAGLLLLVLFTQCTQENSDILAVKKSKSDLGAMDEKTIEEVVQGIVGVYATSDWSSFKPMGNFSNDVRVVEVKITKKDTLVYKTIVIQFMYNRSTGYVKQGAITINGQKCSMEQWWAFYTNILILNSGALNQNTNNMKKYESEIETTNTSEQSSKQQEIAKQDESLSESNNYEPIDPRSRPDSHSYYIYTSNEWIDMSKGFDYGAKHPIKETIYIRETESRIIIDFPNNKSITYEIVKVKSNEYGINYIVEINGQRKTITKEPDPTAGIRFSLEKEWMRECSIKCVNSLHHPRFLGVSLRGDDWRP